MSLETELALEKERVLFVQAPVSNATIIIMSLLLFLVLHNRVDSFLLTIMVVGALILSGLRILIWYLHRIKPEKMTTQRWLQSYTAVTGLLGFIFGSAYIFG